MSEIIHIRIKKSYATSLLEKLIEEEAIEKIDDNNVELTDEQKRALDIELEAISADPQYLKKWDEVKHQFKRS